MKNKTNLLITTLFASGALALPLCAQTTPATGDSAAAASPAMATSAMTTGTSDAKMATAKAMHFGGTVSKIDTTAKTVTVENKKRGTQTFQLTETTKVTNGTADAKLEDVKVGDHVHGAYMMGTGGAMELETLKMGASEKKMMMKSDEKK